MKTHRELAINLLHNYASPFTSDVDVDLLTAEIELIAAQEDMNPDQAAKLLMNRIGWRNLESYMLSLRAPSPLNRPCVRWFIDK